MIVFKSSICLSCGFLCLDILHLLRTFQKTYLYIHRIQWWIHPMQYGKYGIFCKFLCFSVFLRTNGRYMDLLIEWVYDAVIYTVHQLHEYTSGTSKVLTPLVHLSLCISFDGAKTTSSIYHGYEVLCLVSVIELDQHWRLWWMYIIIAADFVCRQYIRLNFHNKHNIKFIFHYKWSFMAWRWK